MHAASVKTATFTLECICVSIPVAGRVWVELKAFSADAVAIVMSTPAIIRVIAVDNLFVVVAFHRLFYFLSEVLSFNKRYEFVVLHKYTRNQEKLAPC